MNLEELKALLGIPLEDTDDDTILKIKLSGALETLEIWFVENAKPEYVKYDSNGKFIVPDGAKLAVSKYIEASEVTAGVRSESIGGMSQSYGSSSNASNVRPIDDFYEYLAIYKKTDGGITFIPMRKYK